MKQLRQQYEDTRTQDEDHKAALMDQIKPGYLALYNEKKASLGACPSILQLRGFKRNRTGT